MSDQLIIIQPTEFCNINCKYCYLPNRTSKARISFETLECIFKAIHLSPIFEDDLNIVWHAGEPLAVPPSFYRLAFNLAEKYNVRSRKIRHSIQTNATLITDEWCALFRQFEVDVSVSIDGPQFIHDQYRVTRQNTGTFDRVMRGISTLKHNNLGFGAICVLTRESLEWPDALYDFFRDLDCREVNFNIDELVGVNKTSSMRHLSAQQAFRSFVRTFYRRIKADSGKLKISNFEKMRMNMLFNPAPYHVCSKPLQVVSFDHAGNFSTFSPDFLTWSHPGYSFIYGNIVTDTLNQILEHPEYLRLAHDIEEGVSLCQHECEYFSLCGGGDPSSKVGEFGTPAVSDHLNCQFRIKACADVLLSEIEEEFKEAA